MAERGLASAGGQVRIILREIDDLWRRYYSRLLGGTPQHVVPDSQRGQDATARAQCSRDQHCPMEPGRERSRIGVDGRRDPGQGRKHSDGK